jgi:peptide chain release factor 1
MYQRYAQKMGWNLNVLACHLTDLGGFKEISFDIRGSGVEGDLKYESGVHRVQRIPETEKSGRIHTSTVSVIVLPKPKEKDIEINPQDIRVDVYRASGPGGQYVNRRESAVRIIHIPTGIMATSQSSRTQVANRENAMSVLRTRLYDLEKEKEEEKMDKEKKSKVKRRMRAEKIRTYNFPQDRITDHRIKKSWGHIENILQGNLEELIKPLKENLE